VATFDSNIGASGSLQINAPLPDAENAELPLILLA